MPKMAVKKVLALTERRGEKRARSQTPEEASNIGCVFLPIRFSPLTLFAASNSMDTTATPSRPQRLKKLTEKGAYNSTLRSVVSMV